MALPFPDDSFDAAVMALVIFFVPDPAKGVAEMVRVVRPDGPVATYAWDMMGGGFPMEPIQAEKRARGPEARPWDPYVGLKPSNKLSRIRRSWKVL